MNWFVLIPVGLLLAGLIAFMIRTNRKEETKLEDQLKKDFPKRHHDKPDADPEETTH